MAQVLPKGVPTLIALNSRNYMRPDNAFINDALVHALITCTANPEKRLAKMDHIPITTTLDIQAPTATANTQWRYRKVDWEALKKTLSHKLRTSENPKEIGGTGELIRCLNTVTTCSTTCSLLNYCSDSYRNHRRQEGISYFL